MLNVSEPTLRSRIREYGPDQQPKFDNLTDEILDDMLRDFKRHHPESGRQYATGYLKKLGHRVHRNCIWESLQRIDGLGQQIRCHQLVQHCKYSVPRSNHLWRIDRHHKLIAWGIVIHGVIDGFCRTVSANHSANKC